MCLEFSWSTSKLLYVDFARMQQQSARSGSLIRRHLHIRTGKSPEHVIGIHPLAVGQRSTWSHWLASQADRQNRALYVALFSCVFFVDDDFVALYRAWLEAVRRPR